MAATDLKVVTTKLAKQVSGYALIMNDMQFSSRVFALAAKQSTQTLDQIWDSRPSVKTRVHQMLEMDAILRKGGVVAQIDPDYRSDSEVIRSALFEAGIVTYARCFNAGLRTRLSDDIFTGNLAAAKKLHKKLIDVRNKHIAHSELKMENSIIGCQLVEDQNYGPRPNLVMGIISMRRHFPADERLAELEIHCNAIIAQVILPKLMESTRALREQLLKMPPEQIASFQELRSVQAPAINELL